MKSIKICSLTLVLVLALGLAGCNRGGTQSSITEVTPEATLTPVQATPLASQTAADSSTQEPTPTPTQGPANQEIDDLVEQTQNLLNEMNGTLEGIDTDINIP